MKRLFVAIDLQKELKDKIDSEFIEKLESVKKVPKENLHITLAFIGDANENAEKQIIQILNSIEFSKFPILLGGAGDFDERVIWIGVQAIELFELAEKISGALHIDNEFSGHVTIARSKEGREITEEFKKIRGKKLNQTMKVDKFTLFESKPSENGSVYSKVCEFKAGKKNKK